MSVEFDKDMWLIALCAWNNVPCDSAAMAKCSDENWGKLSVDGWKRVATALEQEIIRRNQSTILQPMQKTDELLDIIGKFWTGEYYPGHEEAAERITSVSSAKQQPSGDAFNPDWKCKPDCVAHEVMKEWLEYGHAPNSKELAERILSLLTAQTTNKQE